MFVAYDVSVLLADPDECRIVATRCAEPDAERTGREHCFVEKLSQRGALCEHRDLSIVQRRKGVEVQFRTTGPATKRSRSAKLFSARAAKY
jgi:hypothetical protein